MLNYLTWDKVQPEPGMIVEDADGEWLLLADADEWAMNYDQPDFASSIPVTDAHKCLPVMRHCNSLDAYWVELCRLFGWDATAAGILRAYLSEVPISIRACYQCDLFIYLRSSAEIIFAGDGVSPDIALWQQRVGVLCAARDAIVEAQDE